MIIIYNSFIYKKRNYTILIFIFSCNRDFFLNITIKSLINHFSKYEKNILFTIYFSDSGSLNREHYSKKFNFHNIIFMNPTTDNYAYNLAFSMLYMKYVLFIEDDRPFINNIEEKIIYKNFIEEGIAILETNRYVYGITFKPDIPTKIKVVKVRSNLGYHVLCIVVKPDYDYYYVNGPTIYDTRYLKLLDNYKNEREAALFFKKLNLYYGYTYKNIKCKENNLSVKCQSVSIHLDSNRKFSTNKNKRCNIYMY